VRQGSERQPPLRAAAEGPKIGPCFDWAKRSSAFVTFARPSRPCPITVRGGFCAVKEEAVSTTTTDARELEFREVEVLMGQVSKELEAAFRSLITCQRLVTDVWDHFTGGERDLEHHVGPEHQEKMGKALARIQRIEEMNVWEIEHAGSGAMEVKDLLELIRFRRENRA
jgi:hypothetical protein